MRFELDDLKRSTWRDSFGKEAKQPRILAWSRFGVFKIIVTKKTKKKKKKEKRKKKKKKKNQK
jgi:hypothetical protein